MLFEVEGTTARRDNSIVVDRDMRFYRVWGISEDGTSLHVCEMLTMKHCPPYSHMNYDLVGERVYDTMSGQEKDMHVSEVFGKGVLDGDNNILMLVTPAMWST